MYAVLHVVHPPYWCPFSTLHVCLRVGPSISNTVLLLRVMVPPRSPVCAASVSTIIPLSPLCSFRFLSLPLLRPSHPFAYFVHPFAHSIPLLTPSLCSLRSVARAAPLVRRATALTSLASPQRKDNAELNARNVELQRRMADTEAHLRRAEGVCQRHAATLSDHQAHVDALDAEKRDFMRRSQDLSRARDDNQRSTEQRITQQEAEIAALTQDVETLSGSQRAMVARLHEADSTILEKEEAEQDLRSENSRLRAQMQHPAGSSLEQMRAEADHLKIDNARLVELISHTSEYADFLQYSRDSNGISFLPPSKTSRRGGGGMGGKGGQKGSLSRELIGPAGAWGDLESLARVYNNEIIPGFSNAIDPKREKEHWVPSNLLHSALDFKHKHLRHVPAGLMAEFLRLLNVSWWKREEAHVTRVKRRCLKEIRLLRRQIGQRVPYCEVIQKNKIDGLTRSLKKKSKSPGKSAHRGLGKTNQSFDVMHAAHDHLMDSTLGTVENLSRQVAVLSSEKRNLQARLDAAVRCNASTT